MRAIIGRQSVRQWLGDTLCNALVVDGVNREHAEMGVADKCDSVFEGFHCARAHGHAGFHFSRAMTETGQFKMTATWQKGR